MDRRSIELSKEILLYIMINRMASMEQIQNQFREKSEGDKVVFEDYLTKKVYLGSQEFKEAISFLIYKGFLRFIAPIKDSSILMPTEKSYGLLEFDEFMDIGLSGIEFDIEAIKKKINSKIDEIGEKYID